MFSFNIEGIEKTLDDLEFLFSPAALLEIKDKALNEGAEFLYDKLYAAQNATKDTGATRDELTFSEPRWYGGERVITVHWKGPKDRYKVIHLVENGFYGRDGKFVKPEAYGQIESVLVSNERAYINVIQRSIARQIGGR